jgi:hypothetical protein
VLENRDFSGLNIITRHITYVHIYVSEYHLWSTWFANLSLEDWKRNGVDLSGKSKMLKHREL